MTVHHNNCATGNSKGQCKDADGVRTGHPSRATAQRQARRLASQVAADSQTARRRANDGRRTAPGAQTSADTADSSSAACNGEHAEPGTINRGGEGVVVEDRDGAEVRQRFHADQRDTTGNPRPRHRQCNAPGRRRPTVPKGLRDLESATALVSGNALRASKYTYG